MGHQLFLRARQEVKVFSVNSSGVALALCVVTMLGWGSWANTIKLAGRRSWPFELYYWDYVLGMLFCSIAVAFTFGSHGEGGPAAVRSLTQSSWASLGAALLSGALFNCSNMLIVIATDLAGIVIAFPVAVGLALIIGTIGSYIQAPSGRPLPLFAGVLLILAAMLLSAYASRVFRSLKRTGDSRGILFAIASGCLMGFFYPRLSASITPSSVSVSGTTGKLTPYAAAMVFSAGLVLSNFIINTVLLYVRKRSYREYFGGPFSIHFVGIAGGAVWMVALIANLVASKVAGPAVSYALGQGATLVAAIWGIFIWKEFRGATGGVNAALSLMFLSYAGGLFLVGLAAF